MTDADVKGVGFDRESYACFLDKRWRMNNLYHITDKQGRDVVFKMNDAQADFLDNVHEFNVILKARQLGFSTLIAIYALDECIFVPNWSAGVIAQGLVEAEDLFKNKVKYAYDKLPRWLRRRVGATTDTARKLEFSNGSSIQVGTSLRGGTFQVLHVSEYGKIAARYPDKAREIKTGALNTVHVGQRIFIESTAEGQQGEFFDLVERAQHLEEEGLDLTPLDPKLHFYGWMWDSSYTLDSEVSIKEDMADYFRDVERKTGKKLTAGQKAWYVKKSDQQGDYMQREYPSLAEEPFKLTMEGAYFTKQMTTVRKNGQITHVPWEAGRPVDTWWDLGMNDSMTIWFFQHIAGKYRFIDYYEDSGEGLEFYAQVLRQKGYYYGTHYWPHDGNVRDLSTGKQRQEAARGYGIWPIKILPRTNSKNDDIQALRLALPRFWFDKDKCEVGIRHVDNYRKEWNDKLGVWKDSPRHDAASHGVDPLLNFARNFQGRKDDLVEFDVVRQEVAEGSDYDLFSY